MLELGQQLPEGTWRDLTTARAMPSFCCRRPANIEILREFHSDERRLYSRQHARTNAQVEMNVS